MRLGMIGYGTVGQGVADLLVKHREVYRARCGQTLDLAAVLVRSVGRTREVEPPEGCVVTDDPERFFGAGSSGGGSGASGRGSGGAGFDVLVEVAGGVETVRGHVERALGDGRHVVTANKSLVSAHGARLLALARDRGVELRFEAAVAGGIPVVGALMHGLMGNAFERIEGVVNGTCNFLLTTMEKTGRSYEEVLREAQRLGYAEADPTMDVSGRDSAEKISILGSLAFGDWMTGDEVETGGIEGVTVGDLRAAVARGRRLRLVARVARAEDGGVRAEVGPRELREDHPLARLDGSANAVTIIGDAVGEVTLSGAGAGRYPTASAVVSDVVAIARG
ncbi:MAG: homoserine dehydrogenase [Phycisphaeraceae bacterium]|nr:MAG: homoserine dehydrogenase [Phycisphaeraceae bacterium]